MLQLHPIRNRTDSPLRHGPSWHSHVRRRPRDLTLAPLISRALNSPPNHLCTAKKLLKVPTTVSQSTTPIAIIVAGIKALKNLPSDMSLAYGLATNRIHTKIPGIRFHR